MVPSSVGLSTLQISLWRLPREEKQLSYLQTTHLSIPRLKTVVHVFSNERHRFI